jgi:transcriptional regulator with XRE-family HTH domain
MPFNGIALPGLKEARLRAALTQEELAARAGVARTTLARLETGAPAAPATARKLAAALGVLPNALMEPEDQGKALGARAA